MLTDSHPDEIGPDDVTDAMLATLRQSKRFAPPHDIDPSRFDAGDKAMLADCVNAWRRHRPDAETLSTHVGWDNSDPPQLWRWAGSLAEADESAEPLERLEHASDVVKAPDPDAETPPEVALTDAERRGLEMAREACGDQKDAASHQLRRKVISEIAYSEALYEQNAAAEAMVSIDALLARSADPSAWCVVRREDCRAIVLYARKRRGIRQFNDAVEAISALAGEAPAAEGDG